MKRFFWLLTLVLLSLVLLAGWDNPDSNLHDTDVIDEPDEYHVAVEGRWACAYYCIEFDAEGNWKLYSIDGDGDVVDVVVLSVDEQRHRISLSMKQAKKQ